MTGTNKRIGIPDSVFGVGDKAASNAVSRLQLLPLLVMASKLCPPGIEGTLFAFLMSVSNFGAHVGVWFGAGVLHFLGISRENFDNLWIAVVIRTVFRLSPIFFLFLVPEGNSESELAPPFDDLETSELLEEEKGRNEESEPLNLAVLEERRKEVSLAEL